MGMESAAKTDQAAAEWLAKRDSNTWSEADQRAFDAWLAASTVNQVAYLRIERGWEEALRLKALGAGHRTDRPPPPGQWNLSPFFDSRTVAGSIDSTALSPSADDEPQQLPQGSDLPSMSSAPPGALAAEATDSESPSTSVSGDLDIRVPRKRSSGLRRIAWAASLILGLSLGLYALNTNHFQGNTFSTQVGGVELVPLSDGSRVTLNTDSQIHLELSPAERKVELKHGEAFFEVAKDPKRPFVVSVGQKRVIAVGTKFSVLREANDMRVVVTEGKVRVESAAGDPQGSAEFVSAGMVARATDDGVLVQAKPLPEAQEHLSWLKGILTFRETTLGDAVAEFNRYNTRKIVIQDAAVAGLRVAGSFRSTNVDAFVRLLEQGYPIQAEQEGGEIVLKSQ